MLNKYACYAEADWKFDIEAKDEREALARARAFDAEVTRVELIAEGRGRVA